MKYSSYQYVWAVLRIAMGWIFLWAFLDKLLGLGFKTAPENAWLAGGSPTFGFLKNATYGPIAPIYQAIAGHPLVDWLFMLGLAGVGIGLVLGIAIKLSAYSGALLMFLMWIGTLPPSHNPFIDEHVIYLLVLIAFPLFGAEECWSAQKWWQKTPWVRKWAWFA